MAWLFVSGIRSKNVPIKIEVMDMNERASMIGYYRMGATWDQIGWLMGIPELRAKTMVEEYLASIKKSPA